MADYKSREAWDPTVMSSAPEGQNAPAPISVPNTSESPPDSLPSEISPEPQRQQFDMGDLSSAEIPTYKIRRKSNPVPWLITILLLIGAGAFIFFYYLPLAEQIKQQADDLVIARSENTKLAEQINELKTAAASLQNAVDKKDQVLAELSKTQDELSQKLQEEIKKGEVLINQRAGELVVDVSDQILFDSGEAELNSKGKAVLKKVGETFLKIKDKIIQVGGHTDNIPISPKLHKLFASNWDLSTARATNVVRFLQDEIKVPGRRLVAAGFSEYRPSASNRTAAGRHKNRRIEVVLLPSVKPITK
ncbi:MAG: OmpA family protein [Deltaproteobacteria bacterium]|nr:OmpA family protein [Deltaproteobacteria bacterium]